MSLLIALVFMIVLSVLLSALFFMAFTNIRSLRDHRRERVMRYNADSALQLGINKLAGLPTQAASAGTSCTYPSGSSFPMPMNEPGTNTATIVPGSYLSITCVGAQPATVAYATNGARYVSFKVVCANWAQVGNKVNCGSGTSGVTRTFGTALVMYDIDTSITVAANAAVVPKILEWDVNP